MATSLIVLAKVLFLSVFSLLFLNRTIKPIVGETEFNRWVISWGLLTSIAFMAPNLMVLYLVMMLVTWQLSKKSEQPLGLYLAILFVIPVYTFQTKIINFSYQNVISLALLFPLYLNRAKTGIRKTKTGADFLVYGYVLLVFLLHFRGLSHASMEGYYLSTPAVIKYGFDLLLQVILPYYLLSKYIKDFKAFKTVLAGFVTAGIFISLLAIFETVTSDVLYVVIPAKLGIPDGLNAVLRDGLLRAKASTEHPITLGTVMMLCLGLYIYLSRSFENGLFKIAGYLMIIGGLIASLSRGPWTGAAVVIMIFYLFGRGKFKKAMWLLVLAAIGVAVIDTMGYTDKLIKFLPFVGDVDAENVDYRLLLLQQSLLLIFENPIFGMYDPRTHEQMLILIQGEGIIDLVNVYLTVAMTYGLVGFFLYTMFLLTVNLKLLKVLMIQKDKKSDMYLCGVALLAIMLGFMAVIAVTSNSAILNSLLFSIGGLIISYVRIVRAEGAGARSLDALPTSKIV